jgi:hypothetical protein
LAGYAIGCCAAAGAPLTIMSHVTIALPIPLAFTSGTSSIRPRLEPAASAFLAPIYHRSSFPDDGSHSRSSMVGGHRGISDEAVPQAWAGARGGAGLAAGFLDTIGKGYHACAW